MTKKRFACIVGARPNFMKMAPILRAFDAYENAETVLIHTGQHYDRNLSDVFFEELGIKTPDVSLGIGSGSHGEQTGRLIIELEKVFMNADPSFDRVVVVGDVNSTMAATLAAVKLNIPVAHVEAGLRSFDRRMPEEANRIVTDSLSDLLLVSEPSGIDHLTKEGHPQDRILLVGNVMIDTLLHLVKQAAERPLLTDLGLEPKSYAVVTAHRPSNVDQPETLKGLIDVLVGVSEMLPIVFPVHPRTKARLESYDLLKELEAAPGVTLLEPLGYLDFLCLTSQSRVIVTDSGGLQEESTALQIPCLTMRENTERPVTVTEGTSVLCGSDPRLLDDHLRAVLNGTYKSGRCPELWDGKAAERIVAELMAR
ncbi:MAG: UDP-N-acetylglucosamine 2-epimerase (non-hydrolyzing) [Fuerstiella sp.]|nr:UDP-N-acetylglucosamine 2-epimerase (non-hydrolyzing) [Fuerstiella sp.]